MSLSEDLNLAGLFAGLTPPGEASLDVSDSESSDGEGGAAATATATAAATALRFPNVSSGAALALGFGTAHDGVSQDTFVLCDRLTRSGARATATASAFGLAPARRHLAEGGQAPSEEMEECPERQSFYAVCVVAHFVPPRLKQKK